MIAYATITLYVPWAHSLKDKRMVVKKLIDGARVRFNISIAEVDALDVHQTIVLGVAGICQHHAQADKLMEQVLSFIQSRTDAEIVGIDQERL